MTYGTDVKWQAGEIAAFRIYNELCREQALAAFNASKNGVAPQIVPAKDLAARARREAGS